MPTKKTLEKLLGFTLTATENPEFGDYSSNIAMVNAKFEGKNPHEYAENLKGELQNNEDLAKYIQKIEVAGPGFINFWLKTDVLVDNLIQISRERENYGKSNLGKGKTLVIDYSSPNIAKPFGIGHLRSTIIGQALYNLYKYLGYEVVGDNHLGDWGTQFGKLLYMIVANKPKKLSVDILEKLYVEFHKLTETDKSLEEKARLWFKKLESGDSEAKDIWQKCVVVSLEEFDRIYKLLDIKIDFAFGESYYESEMKQLETDRAVQSRLSEGEDGARIIDLSKFGIKTPLMFLKSDGATTYATRDLATIKFRQRKWNPDAILYEVGAEQSLHFEQVFAAAKLLKLVDQKVKLVHTAHGLYLAPDGKKFSTRKGKTVKLEEVLNEAIDRAGKLQKDSVGLKSRDTSKAVGIGAIKYFDLMHSVQSNIVFDWEKIINLQGNSGPYLQYTVARSNSVLNRAQSSSGDYQIPDDLKSSISNLTVIEEELTILKLLARFGEVVEASATTYSPNLLCNYLFSLAQSFNGFYNSLPILEERTNSKARSEFRLALTFAVGQVIKNGLRLLGIKAPESM